jgi:hypothetical protein
MVDDPRMPEELAHWRTLLELRHALVEEARAWSAPDHPVRLAETKAIEVFGESTRTDEALAESDAVADKRAESALAALRELDAWIDATTRWKAEQRGRTLAQLRTQIDRLRLRGSRDRAEEALTAWLRNRDDQDAMFLAALWLWRYENRSHRGTPDDFVAMTKRLDALEVTDRAARIGSDTSGEAQRRAARMLAEAEKSWAED